jgi:hypothetical protein
LAAHYDVGTAKALLGVMTGLQACFALHALVQWPYISQVLNCVELGCGVLEVAFLSVTIAAYSHTQGDVKRRDQQLEVSFSMAAAASTAYRSPRCNESWERGGVLRTLECQRGRAEMQVVRLLDV